MGLAPTMTMGDARDDLLERLGFADLGSARTRAVGRCEAFIRQAVNELVYEVEWTALKFRMRLPLVAGQTRYEFPEEVQPNSLGTPLIERIDGSTYPLNGGIRPQDWGDAVVDPDLGVGTGSPDRYRFVDGEIDIYPAVKDLNSYTNIVIDAKRAVPAMRDPADRLPFDPEVIIQRALVLGRTHYQKPGVDDAKADFKELLRKARAQQGVPQIITVGGRKSHYVRTQPVPRTGGDNPSIGNHAPASPDWHPW